MSHTCSIYICVHSLPNGLVTCAQQTAIHIVLVYYYLSCHHAAYYCAARTIIL